MIVQEVLELSATKNQDVNLINLKLSIVRIVVDNNDIYHSEVSFDKNLIIQKKEEIQKYSGNIDFYFSSRVEFVKKLNEEFKEFFQLNIEDNYIEKLTSENMALIKISYVNHLNIEKMQDLVWRIICSYLEFGLTIEAKIESEKCLSQHLREKDLLNKLPQKIGNECKKKL